MAAQRLLDRVRKRIRTRHLSYRIEQTYLAWILRFIRFHGLRHPKDMGATEVEAFLTHLAVDRNVSASTQNQALNALLFLYREVLGQPFGQLDSVTRAQRPKCIPVVLSVGEVARVLANLSGVHWLICCLQYGSGLRLMEVSGQTPPLYLSVGEYGFHRIVSEACLPFSRRELDRPTRRMHADALQHIDQIGVRVHVL